MHSHPATEESAPHSRLVSLRAVLCMSRQSVGLETPNRATQ
nr:MAG TPA: hypothetical protein [Caudoviricetes sp.]